MKFYKPILSTLELAVQAGLREAAEVVLDRSNALAPVDTGTLRASGFVSEGDLQVQVGYDDPATGYPYIARQHEDMDYQHPGGGGPKFLERAEAETRGEVAGIVAKHVRGALGE